MKSLAFAQEKWQFLYRHRLRLWRAEVRVQMVVFLFGVLVFSLFFAPVPVLAQKQVFYYEDTLGFDKNDRQNLEFQLSGAVWEGSPAKGRKILQDWDLWPWVSNRLKETGTFAHARELVLNRNEAALRSMIRFKFLGSAEEQSMFGFGPLDEEDENGWTYAGQVGRLLRKQNLAAIQAFLNRENLTALALLGAMVFFVLPKRTLRKLLGVRHSFRRRIA